MKNLTIVTICFNNKEGLIKTIKSIENQSFLDFEFIVIDGGSTDGSLEIIKNCNLITTWISEKDNGVYHAMNKGIKKSNGKYINFMNSGDEYFNSDVLFELKDLFEEDYDILYGNTLYYNKDNYRREEIPPSKLSFFYLNNYGINHQATFIKKQLFFDSFFYNEDYKICSDWEFFIFNLCLRNATYKYINLFICNYDFSGISANPNNLNLYYEEKIITLKKYFPLFYNDFELLNELKSKRLQQILFIKKKKIAWRILKWLISLVLLFTGKQKKAI